MEKYTLKIELLSDTIFSGGEAIASVSDIDVLYDEYKIPYYKGKSIKGNLRETIDIVIENQKTYNDEKAKENNKIATKLFGKKFTNKGNEEYRDDQSQGILKFENASISQKAKDVLKYLVDTKKITSEELIDSMTDIRYATKINRETGTSEDHSLRSMRVLNKGSVFYADIYTEEKLNDNELGLLVCGVQGLRHLGTLRSRGKGEVKCDLEVEGKLLGDNEIKNLVEKVIL